MCHCLHSPIDPEKDPENFNRIIVEESMEEGLNDYSQMDFSRMHDRVLYRLNHPPNSMNAQHGSGFTINFR